MSLNPKEMSLTDSWNGSKMNPSPFSEIGKMLPPTEPLILDLQHCTTGLIYLEDGSRAPDQNFYYSIELNFATQADQDALYNHPDRDEIVTTMEKYMREDEGVRQSFELELSRDQNPAYTESGEAGPNSLTSGTRGDLEVSVDEMTKIINQTYGLNIQSGTIQKSASQVEGCGPSSDAIPENLAKAAPLVKPVTTFPVAGM